MKIYVAKEIMDCSSEIEATYYSALADSKSEDPLICYACGSQLNEECFEKYIEMKKKNSIVQPTCGTAYCLKDKKKRFVTKRARKADKKWKDLERARKKLQNMKARQQNQESMEIEEEEEVEDAQE